jgi:hypothetical protein
MRKKEATVELKNQLGDNSNNPGKSSWWLNPGWWQ